MIKMKVLDYQSLMVLNESSIRARRKQHLKPEQIPDDARKQFTVNFKFDHEYAGQRDIRLSVILKPGVQTAWLDVSPEEFADIPEVEMSELEWEAAVCVGVPRWTE
ncbi:MAG: hypothetical protein HY663_01635 [Chloroflexi bacterium]|nr:hypothetical protein [Chloroflexota bacterium]